jgi:hypothetical protein
MHAIWSKSSTASHRIHPSIARLSFGSCVAGRPGVKMARVACLFPHAFHFSPDVLVRLGFLAINRSIAYRFNRARTLALSESSSPLATHFTAWCWCWCRWVCWCCGYVGLVKCYSMYMSMHDVPFVWMLVVQLLSHLQSEGWNYGRCHDGANVPLYRGIPPRIPYHHIHPASFLIGCKLSAIAKSIHTNVTPPARSVNMVKFGSVNPVIR